MPDVGPCDAWPIDVACCDLTGVSPSVTGTAAMAATEVLWGLSGRRFGECVTTLRPCRDECDDGRFGRPEWPGWGWPFPDLVGGEWFNLGCGGSCGSDCACNTVSQFTLPAPVSRVVDIVIDGAVVPSGSYRLDNERYVVRTDGGEWPICQDLSADSGPGTWLVTVAYGHEVPALGRRAVTELFCQLVALCEGGDCILPVNVSRVTRQGVTVDILAVQELLDGGGVGLYLSDLFVRTFNPGRLRSRPRVFSPDVPRPRRPTGTG